MFKLVKILNSSCNQPELIRIPGQPGVDYVKGNPMIIVSGILTAVACDAVPTYMTVETKTVMREGETVLCYAITPDMVFETESCETPTPDMLGMKVDLYSAGDVMVGIGNYEGGSATVYNLLGATKIGDHVQVRFI